MKKILMYSDSPYAPTGFGQVIDNILEVLVKDFNIDLVAINDRNRGKKFDINMLSDEKDPFSLDLMKQMILRGSYDLLFIVYNAEMALQFAKEIKEAQKQEAFTYLHYTPIDTSFMTPYQEVFVKIPDVRIYYNEYSKKLLNDKEGVVINHGTLPTIFKPEDKQKARKKQGFNGEFVFLNVNSNQWRKDLFRTILAFGLFNKQRPNSKLVLHCNKYDMGGDIEMQIANTSYLLKHDLSKSIIVNEHNKWSFTQKDLNDLYNSADCFITTTQGEGWGLTISESMCCGLPVIAPKISVFEEILPKDNYLYQVVDWVMPYRDTNAPYPIGNTNDIVRLMHQAYDNRIENLSIGQKNRKVAEKLDWKVIQDKWANLFNKYK